jgi:hypothetical protein
MSRVTTSRPIRCKVLLLGLLVVCSFTAKGDFQELPIGNNAKTTQYRNEQVRKFDLALSRSTNNGVTFQFPFKFRFVSYNGSTDPSTEALTNAIRSALSAFATNALTVSNAGAYHFKIDCTTIDTNETSFPNYYYFVTNVFKLLTNAQNQLYLPPSCSNAVLNVPVHLPLSPIDGLAGASMIKRPPGGPSQTFSTVTNSTQLAFDSYRPRTLLLGTNECESLIPGEIFIYQTNSAGTVVVTGYDLQTGALIKALPVQSLELNRSNDVSILQIGLPQNQQGRTVIVEYTIDFAEWYPLSTITSNTVGILTISDPNPLQTRFYRWKTQ